VQLPASQQLVGYVWPFWVARVKAAGGIDRAADLYWLNYYPATYRRHAPATYVVNPNVSSLDRALSGGKTYATVADLQAFLERIRTQARWKAIKANLAPYAAPGLLAPVGGWQGILAGVTLSVSIGGWWWLLTQHKGRR
jgi:hypothetical protein